MTTITRVDKLERGVTDGCWWSGLSLTEEDRDKVELLEGMLALSGASVKVVDDAVENVVEMEEDFRCGKHALRGPNKGQGPRLNASALPSRMRMIGNNFILTWPSGQSKAPGAQFIDPVLTEKVVDGTGFFPPESFKKNHYRATAHSDSS